MQESGPTSPVDEEPTQSPSAGKSGNGSNAKGGSPAAKRPKGPRPAGSQNTTDPVVRWLVLAVAGVIILWLAGILGAMMFGLLTPAAAPRTAAERDLRVLSATVQSGKATTKDYARYVSTLISANQLSKAQQALDEGLKTAKTDRSFLLAQQADLALANKDYNGTVAAADKAMAEAEKELKAYVAANVKNNRAPTAGATVPESYADAALAKSEALLAQKNYAAAVKALDVYLKQSPGDSDILVQRAEAKIQTGDKKGAEADFRLALTFIPDYQPALDGLKQIGASK